MAIKEIRREWSPCHCGYVKTFLCHREVDLADLPKCCEGSKAIVSETDNEYICTANGWVNSAELPEDGDNNGGGSGTGSGLPTGGAAHQQLVTDADGTATWEDRTHWVEAVTGEVIPETECINMEGQFAIPGLTTNPAIVGVNHHVIYNGVGYDCTGMLFEEGEMSGVALGNTAAMGGEATEHPFFMVIIPAELAAEEGVCGLVMPLDGAESVTVSVELDGEVAHPLDEKYIPDSVKPAITNLVNGRASGSARSINAAEDNDETPLGRNAFAFGENAVARGRGSVAIGDGAYVGDTGSGFDDNHENGVAIGSGARAGSAAVALGQGATARGRYAVAIGWDAEAAHAGVAIGDHAEAANNAVALGYWCVASAQNQTVLGYNNIKDTDGKYAFIIGNGRAAVEDPETGTYWPRSNAHTVDWDGNAWFAGYVEGTKLILPSPNGTRWAITVGDDGVLSAAAVTE